VSSSPLKFFLNIIINEDTVLTSLNPEAWNKQEREKKDQSEREREREREREKISNQCNESKSVKEDQLKVEVDLPQWCSQQSCFLQSRELTDGSQPNLPSNGSCFHPINNTEKNNIIGWNYLSVLYNENSYNCKAIMNTQWERERERERLKITKPSDNWSIPVLLAGLLQNEM
jgi:hypothetical protein